jgi:hypothetical protein
VGGVGRVGLRLRSVAHGRAQNRALAVTVAPLPPPLGVCGVRCSRPPMLPVAEG